MTAGMSDIAAQTPAAVPIEVTLREELTHGDAMIGTIAPILRHLLANDEHSVFSDEILASLRGMMNHVARQLLDELNTAAGTPDQRDHAPAQLAALVDGFVGHPGFLSHVHALALEWKLALRMEARLALDPVISPLLQALVSSPDQQVAVNSMALLASQARFAQTQRRMQLPLTELPGDLLHAALVALRGLAGHDQDVLAVHAAAELAIRERYDESRTRLGLISRLVTGMGGGATAALSVTHAGVPMFLSALALASGQDRDMTVLATNEGQVARLALAMRAAGLRPAAIEEQFGSLHPEVTLPHGFENLGTDHAAAMLARSAAYPGS
jgi:hypothetical protein